MKYILASALILSLGAAQAQPTPPPPPKAPAATSVVQKPPANLTCPDRIVWVNTASKVYHVQGDRYFGNTKQGKFTCEKTALADGNHAAKH